MLRYLIANAGQFTTLGVFLRLGVAALAGFLVGLERDAKNKSAGIRTHVLVCIGSALCIVVGQYIYMQFPGGADISRIGSSVVSGVGFLGVGTIIVTGNSEVRGLTTAAGLWTCACIGLAAGAGFIEGVLVTLMYVLFALLVLRYFDKKLSRLSKDFDIYVEIDENHNVKHFLHELRRMNVTYSNVRFHKSAAPGDGPILILSAKTEKIAQKEGIVEQLRDLDYVRFLEDY
ncbi:MAG: MgtC/SapB family protein [Coriobacteriales bacterium]|jgi:putative Mg2+ transporter-C (MgtC) family protein|nr:MgtC/SapB family protein [Coriobacteriales bacterium]